MEKALCRSGLVLSLLAALSGVSVAQVLKEPDWNKVRTAQPEGVSLELSLDKKQYYQGELIHGALLFSNRSAQTYSLWTGTYDRSGRISDIAFFASDSSGKSVEDPLRWYFERGGPGGGLGGYQGLGDWRIVLPVNQWLKFDRPGTYEVYAFSIRVQTGGQDSAQNSRKAVELASNKVTLEIVARDEKIEEQLIQAARAAKAAELEAKVLKRLRYLDTPAARTELLAHLEKSQNSDALFGLYTAEDSDAMAAEILAAVKAGKLSPEKAQYPYAVLKTKKLWTKTQQETPQEKAATEEVSLAYQEAWKKAQEEIEAAAKGGQGGRGEGKVQ